MTNGIGLATPGDTQHARPDITPPAVTGADALRALERQYGTAGLEQAITSWQSDKDVQDRRNDLRQAERDEDALAAFGRMRRRGYGDLADELEANWKAGVYCPFLEPLPPLAVAVAQ